MLSFASILLTGLLSANLQEMPPPSAQSRVYEEAWLRQKAEQLIVAGEKVLYREYVSPADEKAYFDAFPDSFALFKALFGYKGKRDYTDEGEVANPAFLERVIRSYEQYNASNPVVDYIRGFFDLRSIDPVTFCSRVIDIGSQVDSWAPWNDYLKYGYYRQLGKDFALLCNVLAVRSDEVIQKVWSDCCDWYRLEYLQEMLQRFEGIVDARVYQIFKNTFEETQQKEKGVTGSL